jgi:parallel beta-helix repeat protein
MRKLLLIIGFTVTFLLIQNAYATTYIYSCPYTITSPGDYYVMNDLNPGEITTCININSDNVNLDLGGHRIVGGAGTTTNIGIAVVGSNIKIFNGNIVISSIYGGIGIAIMDSDSLQIYNVSIDSTGDGAGIGCSLSRYCSGSSFEDMNIKANKRALYFTGPAVYTLVKNSNIDGGIFFDQYTSKNTICDSYFDPSKVNDYGTANYIAPPGAPCEMYFSSCQILDRREMTYILTQDIIDSTASTCIGIQADNVTLDCQGHIIGGIGLGSGATGIGNNRRNVTIKNCKIYQWNVGIMFSSASNSYISNIEFKSNGDGIWFYVSNNNFIENSTFYLNSYSGIRLQSSDYNTITNCKFSENSYGVYFYGSSYNILKNSIITDSSNAGIGMMAASSNLIYNNILNNTVNVQYQYPGYPTAWCNYWNSELRAGTNIVGGPYIGGNYWTNPNGAGYSDSCIDSDKNGICDNPYDFTSQLGGMSCGDIDYYPLSIQYVPTTTTTLPPTTTTTLPPTTTTTIPFNYTAPTGSLVLIPILLGNPLFFVIVFGLALATAIESKINSGGWVFLLTFIGVLLMFSIFSGTIPLWFVLVLIALVIGGIVFLKRG